MSTAPRPNILYIFTDQQHHRAMRCAGNPDVATPAVDRLAREGVRFENAYCAFPLCTPSRACMFSGLWPHQSGVVWNEQSMNLEAREHGLGNLLARAGYDSAYGGKWHIPWCSPMEAGHGFEYLNAFDDNRLAADTIAFLRRRRDRPFFAVASFDNPHNICEYGSGLPLPWGPIPQPAAADDSPTLPANHAAPPCEPACLATTHRRRDYAVDDWRRYLWTYYRLVEKVDAEVGRILDALDELDLARNTLVIFSSDHGDMAAAHGMWQKLPLYEESVHVPFIVRLPAAIPAGCTLPHLLNNGLDLYATICDYAGVAMPAGRSGHSVRPLVEAAATPSPALWPDEVISMTRLGSNGVQGRMIRTARYKYVAYESGAQREQLFDMNSDPGEMVNLAVSSRFRAVLQEHRDRLRRWCAAVGDNFGYHYTHPRVPFIVPGDEYAPDAGGLPDGVPMSEPPA